MARKYTNFAKSTLASSITAGDLACTVASGEGALFPSLGAGETFDAVLFNTSGQREVVSVTARSTDAFTIVRAQQGSTALAWNAGDRIGHRLTAAALNSIAFADDIQEQTFVYCGVAGGTANALTLTPSPALAAYVTGARFMFKAGATGNSGATTVNVSALGAIAVQQNYAACTGSEIVADRFYWLTLDTATTAQVAPVAAGMLAWLDTVDTAQIDDGAVTTAKIDDAAVTVAKLNDAAATGVKNYIINGGCQIAQTGSVTVTPADNVFIVGGTDMAASACTNRTSMAVNNASNSAMVTGKAHQITLTSSAAGVVNAAFRIEAADAVALNGKTVTFKCKGYQDTGGTLQARLRIRKPTAADNFTTLTTITTSSDFSVATATAVESSLTATLGASDATNGLQVEIEYTTAAAVTGKVFQMGDVQLVEGSVAPAFVPEAVQVTLAKCQRYYEKSYRVDQAPGTVTFSGAGSILTNTAVVNPTAWVFDTYKVEKIFFPACAIYSPNSGALANVYSNIAVADVAGQIVNPGTTRHQVQWTATNDYVYMWHWTADARLK